MRKNKIFIADIGVSALNFKEVLEEVRKYLENGKWKMENEGWKEALPFIIFTPNPEILVSAQKDKEFKRIVNSAQINIPDGQGLIWASRFLGKPLPERITGADLLEKLAELAAKGGLTIGLIGGGPQIAVKAAECLRRRYPGLVTVVFENVVVDQWGNELPGEKILRYYDITSQKEVVLRADSLNILISQYRNIGSLDILFVGFGAPKQEYFIYQLSSIIRHPIVLMAVGGAFDYLAGAVPRAPKWVRGLGFEWLYRLFRQPWRWRRQLSLIKFVFLVFKERLSG